MLANDLELIFGENSGTQANAIKTDIVHFIAGEGGKIEDMWGTALSPMKDRL